MPSTRSGGGANPSTTSVTESRRIDTNAPLRGGGSLAQDLTLSVDTSGFGDAFHAQPNTWLQRNVFIGNVTFCGDVIASGSTLLSFSNIVGPGGAAGALNLGVGATIQLQLIGGSTQRNVFYGGVFNSLLTSPNRYLTSGEVAYGISLVGGGGDAFRAQDNFWTGSKAVFGPSISFTVSGSALFLSPVYQGTAGSGPLRYVTSGELKSTGLGDFVKSTDNFVTGTQQVFGPTTTVQVSGFARFGSVGNTLFNPGGDVQVSGGVRIYEAPGGTPGLTVGNPAGTYQQLRGTQGVAGYQYSLVGSGSITGSVYIGSFFGNDLLQIDAPLRVINTQNAVFTGAVQISGATIHYRPVYQGALYDGPSRYVTSGELKAVGGGGDAYRGQDNFWTGGKNVFGASTTVTFSGSTFALAPIYQGSAATGSGRYVTSGEVGAVLTDADAFHKSVSNFVTGTQQVFGPSSTVQMSGTFAVGDYLVDRTETVVGAPSVTRGATFFGSPPHQEGWYRVLTGSGIFRGHNRFDPQAIGDQVYFTLPVVHTAETAFDSAYGSKFNLGNLQVSGLATHYSNLGVGTSSYGGIVDDTTTFATLTDTTGENNLTRTTTKVFPAGGTTAVLRAQDVLLMTSSGWYGSMSGAGSLEAARIVALHGGHGNIGTIFGQRIIVQDSRSSTANAAWLGSGTFGAMYGQYVSVSHGNSIAGASPSLLGMVINTNNWGGGTLNAMTGLTVSFNQSTIAGFSPSITTYKGLLLGGFPSATTTVGTAYRLYLNGWAGTADRYTNPPTQIHIEATDQPSWMAIRQLGTNHNRFVGATTFGADSQSGDSLLLVSGQQTNCGPIYQGWDRPAGGANRYVTSGDLGFLPIAAGGDAYRGQDNFWTGSKAIFSATTSVTVSGSALFLSPVYQGTVGASALRYVTSGELRSWGLGDALKASDNFWTGSNQVFGPSTSFTVSGAALFLSPVYQGTTGAGALRYVTSGELNAGNFVRSADNYVTGSNQVFGPATVVQISGTAGFGSTGGSRFSNTGALQVSGLLLAYFPVGVGSTWPSGPSGTPDPSNVSAAFPEASRILTDGEGNAYDFSLRSAVRLKPQGASSTAMYRAGVFQLVTHSGVYSSSFDSTNDYIATSVAALHQANSPITNQLIGTHSVANLGLKGGDGSQYSGTNIQGSGVARQVYGSYSYAQHQSATNYVQLMAGTRAGSYLSGSGIVNLAAGVYAEVSTNSDIAVSGAYGVYIWGNWATPGRFDQWAGLYVGTPPYVTARHNKEPAQVLLNTTIAGQKGIYQKGIGTNIIAGNTTIGGDVGPGWSSGAALVVSGGVSATGPIYQGVDRTVAASRYVTSGEIGIGIQSLQTTVAVAGPYQWVPLAIPAGVLFGLTSVVTVAVSGNNNYRGFMLGISGFQTAFASNAVGSSTIADFNVSSPMIFPVGAHALITASGAGIAAGTIQVTARYATF